MPLFFILFNTCFVFITILIIFFFAFFLFWVSKSKKVATSLNSGTLANFRV